MEFIRKWFRNAENQRQLVLIQTALRNGEIPLVGIKGDDEYWDRRSKQYLKVSDTLLYVTEINLYQKHVAGQTQRQFKEPGVGHPTLTFDDRVLEFRGVVERRPIAWAEERVKSLAGTLMYDEQVCVFQSALGKRYYISRNARYHNDGFTGYEEGTGYAATFDWVLLGYYDGDWFPDDQMVEVRQHFTYYAWMGKDIRDTSLLPPVTTKQELKTEIADLKKRLHNLERLVMKL